MMNSVPIKLDFLPTYQDATFSWRDFPDNLSDTLDRLTVLEFLNKPSEELYPVLDDLEIELSVIVENFDIDAIIDAAKRIENLLHLWTLVKTQLLTVVCTHVNCIVMIIISPGFFHVPTL